MNSSCEMVVDDQNVPNYTAHQLVNDQSVQDDTDITDQYVPESVVQNGDHTVDILHNRIVDYWLTTPYLGQFHHDQDHSHVDQEDNINMMNRLSIDDPVVDDTDPGTDYEGDDETDPNDYSDEDLDSRSVTLIRMWDNELVFFNV